MRLGKNGMYGHPITALTILSQKIFCISHTPDSTWVGWMNEWCIYIVLYFVLLYTQSALQSCGGGGGCLSLTTTWIRILRGCVRTCLHMSKGIFRILTCERQTTDSSNLLSCSPCSSDYFVVSNEYTLGKCIGVKVYILTRKCCGVKVKVDWNINTQVKYRYSQKILMYCNKVLLLCYNTPQICSIQKHEIH